MDRINIPEKEALLQVIEGVVENYWATNKISKRGTYQSAETGRDLIPGIPPHVNVQGISSFLCIYDEDSTYNKTSTTEQRRPLNDCVTDFVTAHFFEHSSDRIRFIMLVSVAYEKFFAAVVVAIEQRDGRTISVDALVLLLKGGFPSE
jgi:hypothetical protein